MTTPLVPWYTSNTLIAAIKRKCSVPINQRTFTNEDILALANEVMLSSMVPSIKMVHDNFYAQVVQVPLQAGIHRYAIPDRAIGMGLQDVFFEDNNGNLYEMTQIQAGDKAQYQRNTGINTTPHKFYTEGNDVVMIPATTISSQGFIDFVIYVRPNQLVPDERAQIISSFTKKITVNSPAIDDTLTIGVPQLNGSITNYTYTGITDAASLAAMVPPSIGVVASQVGITNVVNFVYTNRAISFLEGSNGGLVLDPNLNITFTLPIDTTIYSANSYIDFLQTKPGHKLYIWDKQIVSINASTAEFLDTDVPSTIVTGDYICLANECIIPYMPSELHNILAEKTAASVLEALGDVEGLKTAMAKIQDLEGKQNFLIDNRVENAPMKVVNKYSLLRLGKMGTFRRF